MLKKFCSRNACSSLVYVPCPAPKESPSPLGRPACGAKALVLGFGGCAYGFSGVAVLYGLLPSSSLWWVIDTASSLSFFSLSNSVRNDERSSRKDFNLSCSFSLLAGSTSLRENVEYSFRVRENEVKVVEIWPNKC